MDFADRGTLAERIRPEAHGKPDPRRLTVLIDALADGLAAIHEDGVVHRDIKPANILFPLARHGPADTDAPLVGDPAGGLQLLGAASSIMVGHTGHPKDP